MKTEQQILNKISALMDEYPQLKSSNIDISDGEQVVDFSAAIMCICMSLNVLNWVLSDEQDETE